MSKKQKYRIFSKNFLLIQLVLGAAFKRPFLSIFGLAFSSSCWIPKKGRKARAKKLDQKRPYPKRGDQRQSPLKSWVEYLFGVYIVSLVVLLLRGGVMHCYVPGFGYLFIVFFCVFFTQKLLIIVKRRQEPHRLGYFGSSRSKWQSPISQIIILVDGAVFNGNWCSL